MSQVLIFVNPIAGRGRGVAIARRLAKALDTRGVVSQVFDKPPADIPDAALQFDQTPLAAVAIGGDGTLRAAVERLLAVAGGDGARVPPILVVPFGTANLMSRHLGLDWTEHAKPDVLAAALLDPKVAWLDAARANDRLFLLMAGVGIDAAVVHELDRLRDGPIDLTSYAVPALLAIQQYDYPPLRVEIDGRRVFDHEPAMVFVGNVPEYGTGFPILKNARSDDGVLDLCILPCRTRAQVLKLLMATITGDHVHEEGVIYLKGRSIRIESAQSVPVQIDGEAWGHTPLTVELLPSRLPFIVR